MKSMTLKAALLSVVLTIGVLAGPAMADYPPAEPPEVLEKVVEKEAEVVTVVEVAEPAVAVAAMPVTGADAAGLAGAGIALLGLGALALRRRNPAGTS